MFWIDVLRLRARVGRGAYCGLGVLLAGLKFLIDLQLVDYVFGRPWLLAYYFGHNLGPLKPEGGPTDMRMVLSLCAVAAPFMYLGFAMTIARLRDGNFPLWVVGLFFVPVLNFLMFLMLCTVPDFRGHFSELGSLAPTDAEPVRWGPIAISSIFVAPFIGLALTLLCIVVFHAYGFVLFFGVSFTMGLVASFLAGFFTPVRAWEGACAGGLSVIALAFAMLALAIEGAICLLMALPLAAPTAILGGLLGATLNPGPRSTGHAAPHGLLALALLTAAMGFEGRMSEPPLIRVRTSIVVDAPREVVWSHVVGFAEIPPPREALFQAGIAYPVRAEIVGVGVGAVRRCVFSTGAFVEPITRWDEPSLLAFDVTKNPSPMRELNPFGDPHPAHLEGYFISERGQFRLVELPGGRTQLEGTTWYRHRLFPSAYWALWSDALIHAIHSRVLNHVKRLAEAESARP